MNVREALLKSLVLSRKLLFSPTVVLPIAKVLLQRVFEPSPGVQAMYHTAKYDARGATGRSLPDVSVVKNGIEEKSGRGGRGSFSLT